MYRSGELILTRFRASIGETYDLTMGCCTGVSAGQVPEVGSEVLSRVSASGRAVLTRVLVAGDEVPPGNDSGLIQVLILCQPA
ncbi:TPA: hypothetical protein ACN60B_000576 [Escherichia albertii]|uniref:hypothetical protein n=1 Tax=Escherichia TaxID=561 RepID=UPI00178F0FA5|nr:MULTISPECIES: hypothetical protein [Escherichia]MCZ8693897.1 hypothetical protein [Escherichia albertii]MCZ8917084.1 hypothetical protein [Escherichia albertii]WDC02684.1 hypothetical protein PS046_03360 [Escherichia albertii]